MNKLRLSTCILISLIATCFAEEAPKMPKDLQALKSAYTKAQHRTLIPVRKTYKSALEKLLKKYTAAGNLDGVLTVQEELKALIEASSQSGALQASKLSGAKPTSKKNLADFLKGTKWRVFVENKDKELGVVKFLSNGKVRMYWGGAARWEVVSPSTVRIKHRHWTRAVAFSPDFRSYQGFIHGGKNFVHGYIVKGE